MSLVRSCVEKRTTSTMHVEPRMPVARPVTAAVSTRSRMYKNGMIDSPTATTTSPAKACANRGQPGAHSTSTSRVRVRRGPAAAASGGASHHASAVEAATAAQKSGTLLECAGGARTAMATQTTPRALATTTGLAPLKANTAHASTSIAAHAAVAIATVHMLARAGGNRAHTTKAALPSADAIKQHRPRGSPRASERTTARTTNSQGKTRATHSTARSDAHGPRGSRA